MLEELHSSLTMYSGQCLTSCGWDVDGGHFLRIGDVGTRSTVIGADGWRLASGPKFLDTWLENQKANSALSTSTFIKVHQAGQGANGGSKNRGL
jgi:hypothetical protein